MMGLNHSTMISNYSPNHYASCMLLKIILLTR